MSIQNLDELLIEQIRDLYDAEKQLVRALPKMAKSSDDEGLVEAFQSHLEETKGHVARLEKAFEELGVAARGKTCKAMKGLVEEGSETMQEDSEAPFGDLALIAAAQRVEHYEISAYGTCKAVAKHLGNDRIAALLEETENEERAADSKLTDIAESLYAQAGSGADGAKSQEMDDSRKPAKGSVGARAARKTG